MTAAAANDTKPDDPIATDPFCGLRLIPTIAIKGSDEYERLAAEAVTYTWEAVAMQGIVIGIAGAPGEGKTTLMFLLAVARGLTDGRVSVLDLKVEPAPPDHWIVIVEAEHGRNSAARKLLKSARALGLDPARCLERVITIPRSKVILGSPEWKEIERMIEQGIVSDVFVDSLARFAPADANDEKEQAKIFASIAETIERSRGTQPTFWIVMHSRKGAHGATNTEGISGSTQRGGQIDSEVMCTAVKDEQLRVRHVEVTFPKLREEPDEHPGKRAFAVERIANEWRYRDVTDDEIEAVASEKREQRKTARAERKTNEQADDVAAVFEIANEQPGIKTRDLLAAVRLRRSAGKERAEAALLAAKMQRRVETKPGPRQSQLVFPCCA